MISRLHEISRPSLPGRGPWQVALRAILGVLLVLSAGSAFADTLSATTDRDKVGVDETFTLRVRFSGGQSVDSPDFAELARDFDILSNQKSIQHSIINGDVNAFTEWTLVMAPRQVGQFLIPPLSLDGQITQPITIEVTQSEPREAGAHQDIFIETEVDKDEAHVQEQVIVTYRLFYNRSVDKLDRADVKVANAHVEELPHVEYQRTLGQTPYGVAEFRYAIFPSASGTLEIPAALWSVRTTAQPGVSRFSFGAGNYKLYRARTNSVSIQVNPKPDSYPPDATWLPASDFSLSESWSRPVESFKVGEPITRTITMTAQGLRSEQLPPMTFSDDGQFRYYPDQPQQENQPTPEGIVAARTESVAIVPTQGGELTLPAIEMHWWDTDKQELRTAALAARTVTVAGAPSAQATPPPATETDATVPGQAPDAIASARVHWLWPLATGLSVLLSILFASLWWRNRRRDDRGEGPDKPAETSESTAFKHMLNQNSPAEFRASLLHWAARRWPAMTPVTLATIARNLNDEALSRELDRLDANLYGGQGAAPDLAAIKKALREHAADTGRNSSGTSLRPLYG